MSHNPIETSNDDQPMQGDTNSAMIDSESEGQAMSDEPSVSDNVERDGEIDQSGADVVMNRDEMRTRAMTANAKVIDEERRTVRIAISSEEPVERNFGAEILDHSEGSIDLTFARSGRTRCARFFP